MKIRVLYPQGVAGLTKDEAEAGDIISVDKQTADELISQGYAEPEDAKPAVEQATAAPGEERPTRRTTKKAE
jgi:hypothetical protein